jgi:hypothetical protein
MRIVAWELRVVATPIPGHVNMGVNGVWAFTVT